MVKVLTDAAHFRHLRKKPRTRNSPLPKRIDLLRFLMAALRSIHFCQALADPLDLGVTGAKRLFEDRERP